MDKQTMKIIIDKLIKGGIRNILFTGGGDPLVNYKVTLEGMQYAKENKINVGLYTNGSLLTERIINQLMEIDPLFIRISVYGANEKSFSKYTRQKQELYPKIIQNIKLLTRHKLISRKSMLLGLSYLIHPITKEIINLANILLNQLTLEELNQIQYIRFTPSVNYFGKVQHPQDQMTEIFKYIEKTIKPMFNATKIKILPYYHRLKDLNKSKAYNNCRASGWYIEVGPNGDVYLCCEKLFINDYKIGNLVENTITEIFKSGLRQNILEKININNCIDCPPLCKPHELNKIFHEIVLFRDKKGVSSLIKWREDLLNYGGEISFSPGKLNNFES